MLYLSWSPQGRDSPVPVYLNTPMAIDASEMYQRHPEEHRLKPKEYMDMYKLAKLTRTVDESKLLKPARGPMIIISANGMLTGGRILHHVAAYGPTRNAIILSGYQAGGTRGPPLSPVNAGSRRLREENVEVPAKVLQMEDLSAHAGATPIIA